MKAIFERKPSEFNLREVEVEKTLRLPAESFEAVLNAPLRDFDFIKAHTDLMYFDGEGVCHCLLLTGEGRNDGLLVEAEGYGYCRYASYVPNIAAITSPALQRLNELITATVDYIVKTGTQSTTDGNWIIGFDELEKNCKLNYEFNDIALNTLMDMLSEQKAVADVGLTESEIGVCYYPQFCPNYAEPSNSFASTYAEIKAPEAAKQQEIINFILQYQASEIWPWFVSCEEMVGNPQSLQQAERQLADMDNGSDSERMTTVLNEVFGVNPLLNEQQNFSPTIQM